MPITRVALTPAEWGAVRAALLVRLRQLMTECRQPGAAPALKDDLLRLLDAIESIEDGAPFGYSELVLREHEL